jgi:hypothetical protein
MKDGTGRMKCSGITAAALAALAIVTVSRTAAGQEGPRERVDTTVAISEGGTLNVSLYSGRVNVTGTSGSSIRIRGTAEYETLRVRARNATVTISSDLHGHRPGNGPELDISVPVGTRVVIESFSAPLSVRGVKGEAELESMSGSIVVSDAVGTVTAESMSGSIDINGVDGNLDVESVSGRLTIGGVSGDVTAETVSSPIRIARAVSKLVRAESVQGSVSYDGTIEPSGSYSFATHAGLLTLAVPPTTGATVTLETFSGNVDSDFPVTLESGSSRKGHESKFEFRIGDGRSRIVLETFSGDIRIQRGSGRSTQR